MTRPTEPFQIVDISWVSKPLNGFATIRFPCPVCGVRVADVHAHASERDDRGHVALSVMTA